MQYFISNMLLYLQGNCKFFMDMKFQTNFHCKYKIKQRLQNKFTWFIGQSEL